MSTLRTDYIEDIETGHRAETKGLFSYELKEVFVTDTDVTADPIAYSGIKVTGTLTANVSVIVPTDERTYTIVNETTGDFTVTVRTSAGSGVIVPQGQTLVVRCDGVDVRGVYPQRTIYVGSVAELIAQTSPLHGAHYNVTGYHVDSDFGGGVFYWDGGRSKADHDGGTVIDPDKSFPSDFNDIAQVSDWFTPATTGQGVYTRNEVAIVSPEDFGAKGIASASHAIDFLAWENALLVCQGSGASIRARSGAEYRLYSAGSALSEKQQYYAVTLNGTTIDFNGSTVSFDASTDLVSNIFVLGSGSLNVTIKNLNASSPLTYEEAQENGATLFTLTGKSKNINFDNCNVTGVHNFFRGTNPFPETPTYPISLVDHSENICFKNIYIAEARYGFLCTYNINGATYENVKFHNIHRGWYGYGTRKHEGVFRSTGYATVIGRLLSNRLGGGCDDIDFTAYTEEFDAPGSEVFTLAYQCDIDSGFNNIKLATYGDHSATSRMNRTYIRAENENSALKILKGFRLSGSGYGTTRQFLRFGLNSPATSWFNSDISDFVVENVFTDRTVEAQLEGLTSGEKASFRNIKITGNDEAYLGVSAPSGTTVDMLNVTAPLVRHAFGGQFSAYTNILNARISEDYDNWPDHFAPNRGSLIEGFIGGSYLRRQTERQLDESPADRNFRIISNSNVYGDLAVGQSLRIEVEAMTRLLSNVEVKFLGGRQSNVNTLHCYLNLSATVGMYNGALIKSQKTIIDSYNISASDIRVEPKNSTDNIYYIYIDHPSGITQDFQYGYYEVTAANVTGVLSIAVV